MSNHFTLFLNHSGTLTCLSPVATNSGSFFRCTASKNSSVGTIGIVLPKIKS